MRFFPSLRFIILLIISVMPVVGFAQFDFIDSIYVTPVLPDSANYVTNANYEHYRVRIPRGYNNLIPPPLLVGYHDINFDYHSVFTQTSIIDTAATWGWIAVSINGTPPRIGGAGYTHWWSQRVLKVMDKVLDTLAHRYPFNPDSIYMFGNSMGGATGMLYYETHLDPNGYMIAGTAGSSSIIDLLRRVREQIRYEGYRINTSMHIEFGAADTVPGPHNRNYVYKNNSAVVFWDTTNSRHYNLSWLPVFLAAGELERVDSAALDFRRLYGSFMRAETLVNGPGATHGWGNMNPDTMMHWLRHWGKTYRHPTFQNVAADNARRCYDIEFLQLRSDTNVARAYARFDSIPVGNVWYLTKPRLTVLRNSSSVRFHRYLPRTETVDTLIIANHDTAGINLNIRYPINVNSGAWEFTFHPPIPNTNWNYAANELVIPVFSSGLIDTIYARFVAGDVAFRDGLPGSYSMAVFPNPFNGMATIKFSLPNGTLTDLTMYDVEGRVAREFPRKFARSQGAVFFSLPSEGLASGSYFLQAKAGDKLLRQRVTILK